MVLGAFIGVVLAAAIDRYAEPLHDTAPVSVMKQTKYGRPGATSYFPGAGPSLWVGMPTYGTFFGFFIRLFWNNWKW